MLPFINNIHSAKSSAKSMKINVGFGRSTAQKTVSSANKHYLDWSKEHNINSIKTLADYYNVKYNDSKRYALL